MMNGQSFFAIIILIAVFMIAVVNNGNIDSTGSYIESSGALYCDNCSDCTNAINNNSYDTIYLTQDIIDFTEINCIDTPENFSNKIFDCQGHRIKGYELVTYPGPSYSHLQYGVYINYKENITIRNCIFSDIVRDVGVQDSKNITITNNTFYDTNYANTDIAGIRLTRSHGCNITDNTLNDPYNGIKIHSSENNTISDNNVYGTFIDIEYNSINNTVFNNDISGGDFGIRVTRSFNSTIFNNKISDTESGIYVARSNSTVIENNTFENIIPGGINDYVFSIIESSHNNTVSNNNVQDASNYYYTYSATNNTITNMTADNLSMSFIGENIRIVGDEIRPFGSPSIGYLLLKGKYLNISNTSSDSFLFINMSYDDSDISLFNESTIGLYRYNGTSWENDSFIDSGTDEINNYVYANISEFSDFGIFGYANSSDISLENVSLSKEDILENSGFLILGRILSAGILDAENVTMNITLDGRVYYHVFGNMTSGNETSFTEDILGLAAGNYIIDIEVKTDSVEYDVTNNRVVIELAIEEPSSDEPPRILPLYLDNPRIVSVKVAEAAIAAVSTARNYPSNHVSFSNCLLENKTVALTEEGTSVILSGGLDETSGPMPGTATVLLYPQSTDKTYVKKIQCIEPAEYAVVACGQNILASYEVDVISDLTYLCVNYEGYDVDPESISIRSAETGEWIKLAEVWHNESEETICANITAHTPYMVSGLMPTVESVKAKTIINDAEIKIEQAESSGVNTFQMKEFLDDAVDYYDKCEWSEAANSASMAGAFILVDQTTVLSILLLVLFASLVIYFKFHKKSGPVKVAGLKQGPSPEDMPEQNVINKRKPNVKKRKTKKRRSR